MAIRDFRSAQIFKPVLFFKVLLRRKMRKNTYDNQGVNYYLYYTPIINLKEKQHEHVFHFGSDR